VSTEIELRSVLGSLAALEQLCWMVARLGDRWQVEGQGWEPGRGQLRSEPELRCFALMGTGSVQQSTESSSLSFGRTQLRRSSYSQGINHLLGFHDCCTWRTSIEVGLISWQTRCTLAHTGNCTLSADFLECYLCHGMLSWGTAMAYCSLSDCQRRSDNYKHTRPGYSQ
jgi:hypothetical protein